ncbi:general transcription factor II-I repeat domain-containing protein 2-like [Astyanax mexicanus]|uniref:General transcription factor II-I repeat domain-containing protein 2-like n=1 Tax=Astyanax mexicanus TaxID=7994 RepID=A0A8T2KPS1_ASTMX|nr:general transcription factor II-I repeat domain-containing protein 2-like [Astyanax mexicanus]
MTEPPAKKNKARAFQPSWTEDYGFVYVKDRAVCTLCYDNVVCRTSSIKRHFETKHDKTYKDPAERAEAVKRAVARYGKQSSSLKVFVNSQGHVTEASYNLASCIAKHGKPFTDGEYVKEAFLSCAETLFDDLPNKDTVKTRIKDMPTSARTVQRRINEMAVDVRAQQTKGLTDASVFSLALDESVDVNDIPRLAVMARYCDTTTVREELCCLQPMPDTTRGDNIATVIMQHFVERGVDMRKVFAVTTDGAPSMVGKQKGAVKLIEEKVGHPIMKLHCIIHQENLCAKMSNSDFNDVMATVAKVINFLVKRSALTHRQFRSLLEEMDSEYADLPLHSAVRWLSCGKVLERFVSCIDAIKVFLAEKGQQYPQLEDEKWIVKLFFLADITGHLWLEVRGLEVICTGFSATTPLLRPVTVRILQGFGGCVERSIPLRQTNMTTKLILSWTLGPVPPGLKRKEAVLKCSLFIQSLSFHSLVPVKSSCLSLTLTVSVLPPKAFKAPEIMVVPVGDCFQ